MTSLLIVESPSKAKSIGKMLGSGWVVRASMGHVRDLPTKSIGIDRATANPEYEPTQRGKEIIARLRSEAVRASSIFLATDPDREGEAIAWHVAQALKLKPGSYRRVTYHEITETAIRKALNNPRDLDTNLVDAQQARRALDRIVGYVVSPRLWEQCRGTGLRLSAGRVQTPTVRLVVERDRAIANFRATKHYGAELDFLHETQPFTATWDTTPFRKSGDEPYVLDRQIAQSAASVAQARVLSCESGTRRVNPPPPFTTSKLQQVASTKLGLSPETTMKLAQELFETHHAITYHRTDSVALADEAIAAIRAYAKSRGYPLPDKPNRFTAKAKNAQEAHEAIRPTDPSAEEPHRVYGDALKLYKLIHRQAVASQLAPCVLDTRKIRLVNADDNDAPRFEYEAKGQTVDQPGFAVLTGAPKETALPSPPKDTLLPVESSRVLDQQTKPPAAYTEGSLVADLERRGIGRPSTWAAILSNVKQRGYLAIKSKKIRSTPLGASLVDALADLSFANYDYTAALEAALDGIANGEARYRDIVLEGWDDLETDLASHLHPLRLPSNTAQSAKPTAKKGKSSRGDAKSPKCPKCDGTMVKRKSSRGAFWGCARYPNCTGTRSA